MFSRANRKYFYSEGISVIFAIAASAFSAWACDRFTDSDAIISVVSAIGGTIGFICAAMGGYALLHVWEYCRKEHSFFRDMKAIFLSNIHGMWATYLFRIPFQWVLQQFHVEPPLAATVAQFIAGQIGTFVRIYNNYRRNIFGPRKGKPIEEKPG